MSTSDQNGRTPLTRKQLRELRLTGSTPVVTEQEGAAPPPPTPVLPRPAEPAPVAPAPEEKDVDLRATPLTRKQARAQERIRTASFPVVATIDAPAPDARPAEEASQPADAKPEDSEPANAGAADAAEQASAQTPAPDSAQPEALVEEVPAPASALAPVDERPAEVVPVEDVPVSGAPAEAGAAGTEDTAPSDTPAPVDAAPAPIDAVPLAGAAEPSENAQQPRATVNPRFGQGLIEAKSSEVPGAFDELIDSDSAGSQHSAPNALIFTQAPTEASLSGPIAATGEVLITGTYELPNGLGSQGHADGVADGKDVDAVLIDGELPPTSSPTPIAASSAVSTSRPAGEVIRPPAPETGNKLMLTLAIVAGGLALALAAALIVAFTTNVF